MYSAGPFPSPIAHHMEEKRLTVIELITLLQKALIEHSTIELNAYTFTYKGSYLGGTIVVIANNLFDATLKARGELLDGPYAKDAIKHKSTDPVDKLAPTVVYNWDGNY